MLHILALATMAITQATTPAITFTNDSVYKNENVLILEVQNNYEEDVLVSKDLLIKERHMLGYIIYDNPETAYIDGLKFDNQYVYNWTVKDYDDTVNHTFLVKTVYTDDFAGMFAAGKDGDWSKLMANPLTVIQIIYYVLAAVSLILGGFGLFSARKKKAKTSEEIATAVSTKATEAGNDLKEESLELLNNTISPIIAKLQEQNQALIQAFILAQSGDPDAKLALIKLLNKVSSEDINDIVNNITKAIEKIKISKAKTKEEAIKVIDNIAKEDNNDSNNAGGISI